MAQEKASKKSRRAKKTESDLYVDHVERLLNAGRRDAYVELGSEMIEDDTISWTRVFSKFDQIFPLERIPAIVRDDLWSVLRGTCSLYLANPEVRNLVPIALGRAFDEVRASGWPGVGIDNFTGEDSETGWRFEAFPVVQIRIPLELCQLPQLERAAQTARMLERSLQWEKWSLEPPPDPKQHAPFQERLPDRTTPRSALPIFVALQVEALHGDATWKETVELWITKERGSRGTGKKLATEIGRRHPDLNPGTVEKVLSQILQNYHVKVRPKGQTGRDLITNTPPGVVTAQSMRLGTWPNA